MARQRNFLPLIGLLVSGFALASYPTLFSRYPATRDVPWVNWLLFALGLGLVGAGIVRAYRSPERWRGKVLGPILGVLSLAVLGLFLFMTMIYARQLPVSSGAPKVGEKAPDFTLPDSQGRPVRLYDLLGSPSGGAPGSWVILIFYRGYW
jgi:AhpC/TSA family